MFVNHEKAKMVFQELVKNEFSDWIIISGGEHSGKTSFIKEVCPNSKTLFCEPKKSLFYLSGFLPYISDEKQIYTKEFLSNFPFYLEKIKVLCGINYINDIDCKQSTDIVHTLIRIDMERKTYDYAYYLGNTIYSKYKYVVLDDFYKCDVKCYEWLLHFAENYVKQLGYVIVLCDYDKHWESKKMYEVFHNIQDLIDIQKFDTESDYFSVLKDNIYIDNTEVLKALAHELFALYNGDAQLLFKTLKLYKADENSNDYERKQHILKIANNLTLKFIKLNNKVEELILVLLSLSPVPLSLDTICKAIEISEEIVHKILLDQYNNELISMEVKKNKICFSISDDMIRRLLLQSVNNDVKKFILNRIWTMVKFNILNISVKLQLELALEIENPEAEELLEKFINDNIHSISLEKRIDYINQLYTLNLHTMHKFSDYYNAQQAYEFGHYETAYKILLYIGKNVKIDYSYLMLLGSVQHLLLHPEAPETFDTAANLPDITISQRLSALNRKIMSLNQADAQSALKARQIYDFVLKQYSNEKCNGLIELYRNTNNSYPTNVALQYTLKGYQLAIELGNEIEKYKCMHNICMIQLHQNQYPSLLNCKDINMSIEPTFNLVDEFFQTKPQYYHKRAYPLLDLGTYEMFEYIKTQKKEHLAKAKSYYSKAQLLAKSFYARHISEVSLLVTNTHLYFNQYPMIDSVRKKRKEIFEKYTKETIVDHRVHRKILLSLAVSAVLTHETTEARMYLALVKPYISGPEAARYYNLNDLCNDTFSDKMNSNSDIYYTSPYFVPWLISLAH